MRPIFRGVHGGNRIPRRSKRRLTSTQRPVVNSNQIIRSLMTAWGQPKWGIPDQIGSAKVWHISNVLSCWAGQVEMGNSGLVVTNKGDETIAPQDGDMVTSDLTVAEYDLAEQEAIAVLPNLIIEAAQPVVFNAVGYPTRVRRESELIKYVDVMHEGSFEDHFRTLLAGLTEREFQLVQRLTSLVNGFSETKFGRKSLARASILSNLNVFRHIRYLFGDGRPRVFEIGPGNGYLGAMCIVEGYPYAATDVSQALYLYQNHFWNFLSQGKVAELSRREGAENNLEAPAPGVAVHLPWWEFMRLRPETVPEFDVVTCNNAIREMHPNSLGFSLQIARAFLNGSGSPKAFVFHGWGGTILDRSHTPGIVAQRLYQSGFRLVHYDPWITVLAPLGTDSAVGFLDLPTQMRLLKFRLRSYVYRVLGMPSLPGSSAFWHGYYRSSQNPLSRAISSGRESDRAHRVVTIEQLNQFYTRLIGSQDHNNPGEKFLMLARNQGKTPRCP